MSFNPQNHEGFILLRLDNFIMRNDALNLEEKLYLSLAFGFVAQGKCMFASHEWIAYKFGWSPIFVKEMENKLARQGFIRVKYASHTGGGRAVTFILDDFEDPCEGEQFDNQFDIFTLSDDEVESAED
jgi:hypothetical protein